MTIWGFSILVVQGLASIYLPQYIKAQECKLQEPQELTLQFLGQNLDRSLRITAS